jgi:hypothetical protein
VRCHIGLDGVVTGSPTSIVASARGGILKVARSN